MCCFFSPVFLATNDYRASSSGSGTSDTKNSGTRNSGTRNSDTSSTDTSSTDNSFRLPPPPSSRLGGRLYPLGCSGPSDDGSAGARGAWVCDFSGTVCGFAASEGGEDCGFFFWWWAEEEKCFWLGEGEGFGDGDGEEEVDVD